MFTKQFKLGIATIVAALIVVALTFSPSAHACGPGVEQCGCYDEWKDPNEIGGPDGPQPSCFTSIIQKPGSVVRYCGSCKLEANSEGNLALPTSTCRP